jgi:hypothetical protein
MHVMLENFLWPDYVIRCKFNFITVLLKIFFIYFETIGYFLCVFKQQAIDVRLKASKLNIEQ